MLTVRFASIAIRDLKIEIQAVPSQAQYEGEGKLMTQRSASNEELMTVEAFVKLLIYTLCSRFEVDVPSVDPT